MEKKTLSFAVIADLFCVFFKIGLFTFGGGLAMLPNLEKELINKRKWVDKDTLLDYFAIGQSTPGIIAVNVATFIGYNRCGIIGACLATFGVVFPSLIIITAIALFFSNFNEIVWIKKALDGINISVAALLTKVLVGFFKNVFRSLLSFILFILSFACVVFLKINTCFIILAAILIGLVLYFISLKAKGIQK
ncbi:MAG: chromate transporter [Spirochaetaceae bacterium]|nr:chromate transporter [Spirochaetaceae bacterium]